MTLRSLISQQLVVPKTLLNIEKMLFEAAPKIWNQLPLTIKAPMCVIIFIKTELPNTLNVLCIITVCFLLRLQIR